MHARPHQNERAEHEEQRTLQHVQSLRDVLGKTGMASQPIGRTLSKSRLRKWGSNDRAGSEKFRNSKAAS